MLLSTAYLPPVQYFSKMLDGDVYVEQWESFHKQTYRNRCLIDSPNGPLALTVPVEKPENGSRLIRDLRISDHGNWRHQHWQALTSSYFNSPFFEYYQDDFAPFYEKQYQFLLDFNEALMEKCCELIDISPRIHRTETYQKLSAIGLPQPLLKEGGKERKNSFGKGRGEEKVNFGGERTEKRRERTEKGRDTDYRDSISPKIPFTFDSTFIPIPYYQVFATRHGFLPNLSIVDLLFNMGPEALLVLQKSCCKGSDLCVTKT